ncbi:uncharacterized protein [Fopius arisanus]|uniref:Uncharacterized protein n=1 Tax=Fopius arisanus TaxID=64838 RepID=A0A9R1U9S7_9HYME|nr:PREDICTED: uncharacterized protein LOC105272331 [Fopius arisanus]
MTGNLHSASGIIEPFRSSVLSKKNIGLGRENILDCEDGTLRDIVINGFLDVRNIGRKIDRLKGQIVELKNEVAYFRNIFKTGQLVDTIELESEGDAEQDGFTLPCKTMVELQAFDKKLKDDKQYRRKMYAKMSGCLNKDRSISRNLGEVSRKIISQDVGNKITPLKKMNGKQVFKDLKLYSCIYAVLSHKIGNMKEPFALAKYHEGLKGVLNHTGDWNVQFPAREKG